MRAGERAGRGREKSREGRELTLEASGGRRGGVRRRRQAASGDEQLRDEQLPGTSSFATSRGGGRPAGGGGAGDKEGRSNTGWPRVELAGGEELVQR